MATMQCLSNGRAEGSALQTDSHDDDDTARFLKQLCNIQSVWPRHAKTASLNRKGSSDLYHCCPIVTIQRTQFLHFWTKDPRSCCHSQLAVLSTTGYPLSFSQGRRHIVQKLLTYSRSTVGRIAQRVSCRSDPPPGS